MISPQLASIDQMFSATSKLARRVTRCYARLQIALEERRQRDAVADAVRPPLAVVHLRVRADAQGVVDRRQHVLGADRAVGRVGADAVAPAVDLAAADAAAGEHGRRAWPPVLPPLLRVDPRRPP